MIDEEKFKEVMTGTGGVAKPMINCPKCGAERPDLVLPWCADAACPSIYNQKPKT